MRAYEIHVGVAKFGVFCDVNNSSKSSYEPAGVHVPSFVAPIRAALLSRYCCTSSEYGTKHHLSGDSAKLGSKMMVQ